MKKPIIVAGNGGYTADIYETALLLGYEVINLDLLGNSTLVGPKIITVNDVTDEIRQFPIITSSVNYPEHMNFPFNKEEILSRKKLVEQIHSIGFRNLISIIHPSAVISKSAIIGKNVYISANATVASNTKILNNTLINRNVSIGHDVSIGSLCVIAPGTTITSMVQIQESVFIGAGSTILNNVKIGSKATVAAGSLVIHNVSDSTLVMGSPAREKI